MFYTALANVKQHLPQNNFEEALPLNFFNFYKNYKIIYDLWPTTLALSWCSTASGNWPIPIKK